MKRIQKLSHWRRVLIPTLACLLVGGATVAAEDYKLHTFKTVQVTDTFYSEGASFGDIDKDGHGDVCSGPYWYAGPDFKNKHEIYPAKPFNPNGYSDNFFSWTFDINGDGWLDYIVAGFPGQETFWYQNPGKDGFDKPWQRHVGLKSTDNESPNFVDITGDGKPELICNSGGFMGYASVNWGKPAEPWAFHAISPKGGWQRFTHGLGFGDVNGDGRVDLLEKDGWWEQPAKLDGDPQWTRHAVRFGFGGAQMFAYDVDGDGDNDVITSLAAHSYGLLWFENLGASEGEIQFKEHLIMGNKEEQNPYGFRVSQLHAVDLVDMDGDGLKDIITGKRYWAHNGHDPGAAEPVYLFWWKLTRKATGAESSTSGGVEFVPHVIYVGGGVGTQVMAGDVNGDGLPDVVVGNKKGTHVYLQEVKKVSEPEWREAQPKRVTKPAADAGGNAKPQAAVRSTSDPIGAEALAKGVLPVGKTVSP